MLGFRNLIKRVCETKETREFKLDLMCSSSFNAYHGHFFCWVWEVLKSQVELKGVKKGQWCQFLAIHRKLRAVKILLM